MLCPECGIVTAPGPLRKKPPGCERPAGEAGVEERDLGPRQGRAEGLIGRLRLLCADLIGKPPERETKLGRSS